MGVIGVGRLRVLIFAIGGDRGQRGVAEIPVQLARNAVILGRACVAAAGRDIDIAVEGRLVERGRVLTEAEQDRDDRIGGTGKCRGRRARIVEFGIGRNWRQVVTQPCQRGKARLHEGRRAACLILLRIIADEAEAEGIGRLEQRLGADEIAVAIVDVGIVDHVVVETVTAEEDAIDAGCNRFTQRRVHPALDADRIVIAIGEIGIAAEVEFGLSRIDRDHPGRGVAAAQRALRAAQDFDPVKRAELGQRVARARTIDAVHEHGDRAFEAGVVAHGADAADTGRTVGFVTGRGHEQRRGDLVQFANVAGA